MSKRQMSVNQVLKMVFGVFMVFVYLGMAVLMALNVFHWSVTPLWTAVRWFFAIVFGLYGLYRGYRELKGEHTYGMRILDDDNDENTYGSYSRNYNDFKDNDNDKK